MKPTVPFAVALLGVSLLVCNMACKKKPEGAGLSAAKSIVGFAFWASDNPTIKSDVNGIITGDTIKLNCKEGTVFTTYSCPMHPDITSDKPGKCSTCGNDLALSKKEILKKEIVNTYSCPMHPDVTSDKAGKCSSCGMDLTLSQKEILKRKEVGLYKCPMHPGEIADKAGKCSICGMDMTEIKPGKKSAKG